MNLIDLPFLEKGLVVFGVSGLIAGMILSFILGLLVDNRVRASLGGGILGGLATSVLVPFVIIIFAAKAWPSPEPPPGVIVNTVETVGDSGWTHRTRSYTTTLSTNALQQYYDEQMAHYCLDDWQFGESDGPRYVNCLEAFCNIRPQTDPDPQYFYVYLCPVSETLIEVTQEDFWDFD
jgi:hypothetical protein